MDDLKKRLEFQNSGVQIQTLWRLCHELGKKKPNDVPIDTTTSQVPEVNLLLDCLCGSDPLVSEVAGEVIVHLVQTNILEFTFALNSLLNSAPSAKTLTGVVKSVYELLVLQALAIQATGVEYKCPYALRTPPHPVISILTNRPDAWPYIIEESAGLFKHKDKRIQSLTLGILRPFVAFVLTEPQQSDHYADVRIGLQRTLSIVYRSKDGNLATETLKVVLQLLPKIPIQNKNDVLFVCQLVEHMATAIDQRMTHTQQSQPDQDLPNSTWQLLGNQVMTFGLETVLRCISVGAPFDTLVEELVAVAQHLQWADGHERKVLLLAEILGCPHVFTYPQLLTLGQAILQADSCPANPILLATVVKPLLHVLASPNTSSGSFLKEPYRKLRARAGQMLMDTQQRLLATDWTVEQISSLPTHLTCAGYKTELFHDLCIEHTSANMSKSNSGKEEATSKLEVSLASWLDNVCQTLDRTEACTHKLTSLASAILVTSRSQLLTQASVELILKIAQINVQQAPDFLPLMLYVLGQTSNPESKLIVMEAIPQLATHKFCIPPILKTIQALGQSSELKAVSIRLMVLLWQKQERCFPQLLKTVSEAHGTKELPGDITDKVLLAKAAAILEICKHKPEQHGADMLAPLSEILDTANNERDSASCVLALEGLHLLCQAEVIDLRSLWTVLGEKLIHETRPLVITRVCYLLSLVPDLAVETEEYETFAEDTVKILWLYSLSDNPEVSKSAFQALSHFNVDQFRVSYLPREVTEELHCQAEITTRQRQTETGDPEASVSVDQLFTTVPGTCYVSLLKSLTEDETIAGFKEFLQAMVRKEVTNLPRGVFFSSLRRQNVAANQDKAIETIPGFLLQQYDKCKQPGLRPGLAAGLLFCYDPPLEVGRDGRPRKHYAVRHGKTFLQTFTTLLQEVPVQPSEWHRCLLMPQGWNSFMERLFLSLLEGRKAEIDLQEKHGHATVFEMGEKKALAWLWVRDSIVDVIKTTSRGIPAAQANCVLSLAGLALCVHKFANDLEVDDLQSADSSSEHMGHSHWLTVTSDTILSLIDFEYKPKGGLHGLCQQRSTLDRSPASTLCNGMARVAASQLVPIFTALDTDRILVLLKTFSSALPKESKPDESNILMFCNGLALGMMLGSLFEEHFSEMTGSKGMLAVWKALTALEEVCLSSKAENRLGCVLGLGLAICGMCNEGSTESRVHVTSVLEKLYNLWMDTSVDDLVYQALSIAVTSIAGTVYTTNTSSDEVVVAVLDKLKLAQKENPQNVGVCLSLGLITFSLSKLGHQSVSQLRQELITDWLQNVLKEETPPVERVAKLTGLLSMIGSEQTLIPVQGTSGMSSSDVNVSEVISMVTKIVLSHSDIGLQNVSAWMLGHLHSSACAVGESKSSLPANYGYLPESSILRAVVEFLCEAGRKGPESVSISYVTAALESLQGKSTLPPINWAGILSPFMRVNYGELVKTLSLQLATTQMVSSSSAAMFVSSWLTPPLFTSLQIKTQATLHQCMPAVIKSISPAILKLYLERSCVLAFTESRDLNLRLSVLKGLHDALAVDDPAEAVTLLLYEATANLYHLISDEFDIPLLQAMAECLAEVPDDILDSITVADFSDSSTQIKGSFVRCYLVATGRQPLSLLNYMIDASVNTDFWNHEIGMFLTANCLATYAKNKSEMSSFLARQKWLLELLGHTRSIVTGAMPLAETAPQKEMIISTVISVVTCSILTLTYPECEDLDLWGFDPRIFTVKKSNAEAALESSCPTTITGSSDVRKTTMKSGLIKVYSSMGRFLSTVVDVLSRRPWDAAVSKVIDWILTLLELQETNKDDWQTLYAALMILRGSQEFKQVSVWTKAVFLDSR